MILLWLGIACLLLLAIGFIIYPLRRTLKNRSTQVIILSLGLILIAGSMLLYQRLGAVEGLRNAILLQTFNETANQNKEPDLQELIVGLNKQLAQHPDDPITFALLGKIYFTLGDYASAKHAFAKAYELLPDDPELLIDYATAYYLADTGVIDPQLQTLLDKVKKLEPTLASLSLLANVAYDSGDTQLAISYWQAMLALIPKDSELYQEISLMIKLAS